MKIKNLIPVMALVCCVVIASCTNEVKKQPAKTSDSSSVKTPKELADLNAQLAASPDNAELYHKRAKYYLDNRDYNSSLDDMLKAIKIDSSKAEYFLTLSDIYFITNRTGNSKTALEKCIKLDDKNVDAIMKLAELYLYVRKNEKSMEYINMALKIDKYNAKAYFMKGMNYKEMHDTARAISSMQTAVEQDQKYYNAFMQLAILCAAKHNPLAVQYYKNAIKINPSAEAWYDLGKFYQDAGDWNNALATYTTLLKVDANNKNAHYNMGVVYFIGLKKYDLAIREYTDAIAIEPKYVQAYYARGVCYKASGDIKKAITDYDACLAINPDYEPAKESLKEFKK